MEFAAAQRVATATRGDWNALGDVRRCFPVLEGGGRGVWQAERRCRPEMGWLARDGEDDSARKPWGCSEARGGLLELVWVCRDAWGSLGGQRKIWFSLVSRKMAAYREE